MPLLSRRTKPLLNTVNNKQINKEAKTSRAQQYLQRRTPPRKVVSPAHTDDSPLSSADELPVKVQNAETSVTLLSDNDLPSSSPPPHARRPQPGKHNQENVRKSNTVEVLRKPGKRVEHHRGPTESDGQSSGSLKRKRDPSPQPHAAGVAKREDSPIFGEGVESSQKIRKTYSSNQSRAPPSSGNIHAGLYTTKDFKQPPRIEIDESKSVVSDKKQSKKGANLPLFRAPPSIPNARTAKATFKNPISADIGAVHLPDNLTSSSLTPANSSPNQPLNTLSFSISDDSSSPLSSPLGSSDLDDDVQKESPFDSPNARAASPQSSPQSSFDSTAAKCPMCKAPVDRDFLDSFSNGRRMLNREALRFCEAHQQRSAQSRWDASKYPDIDWDGLDARLSGFHAVVVGIVGNKRPSAYRRELEGKLAAKTGRRFLMHSGEAGGSQDSIPGYYGRRGARQMMDYIMRVFGRKLRKESARDAIFKEVGVGGFVQAVLIPEIACCLVMEDMTVGEERAREILKESAGVGELVNAEEEEVVVPVDGEDVKENVIMEEEADDEDMSDRDMSDDEASISENNADVGDGGRKRRS